MEKDLIAQLLANAALAALVGVRISWGQRPQGEPLPGVVMNLVSAPRTYSYDGPVGTRASWVQIDSWGGSFGEAKSVAGAVEAAIHTLAAPFLGGFILNERDDSEANDGPEANGATTLFRTSLDVRVWRSDALWRAR